MTTDPAHIWNRIAGDLREAVGDSMYEVWLASLHLVSFDGADLVVDAPAETRAWIAERFGRVLQASAGAVIGPDVTIHLAAREGDPASSPVTPTSRRTAPAVRADPSAPAAIADTPLDAKYTFEQFVIGAGNRFAHAAALAVAENPGTAYNPLFLCGPPGVGKSHLLHAIGNYLASHGDRMRVRSTTAEAFANEFIAALQGRRIDAFKARYRETDVLLVDDVQFLMAKARTEEEFFHTFNAVRAAGAQIVLTCDRAPGDLERLEDRLRDRFESGLVAPVGAPDRSTRLAVLRKRAHHDQLTVDRPEVLDVLADRVTTNLRALEGALIRVAAFASLSGQSLTPDVAEHVLDQLGPAPAPRSGRGSGVTVEDVQAATCEAFGITREELLSSSRAARVAWPRQVAMYLARELTDLSLPTIGARFAGRGHTTVLHACRRTSARIGSDVDAGALVHELSARLSTGATSCPDDRSR